MLDIAIIVVAFNRPASLERLLRSLSLANYPQEVDLIISIDRGGGEAVLAVANEFKWGFGKKQVRETPANLGLRKHVLQCGALVADYEHLIVLEDDIFVSPAFFNFALQAIKYYSNDDRIAGISLYKHAWNYLCNRPFEPVIEGSDVFFLRHAMSWGQVWSRDKWLLFSQWYDKNSEEFTAADDFPEAIAGWPKSSWLKYHNRYVHEEKKYFVYPHFSLCTNFSDSGTHADDSTAYQVPLTQCVSREYRFAGLDDGHAKYDIYFESESLSLKGLSVASGGLTVDLYGKKRKFERYLLTSNRLPYRIISTFGLELRPHELNVVYAIPGNFFFLYDTSYPAAIVPGKGIDELIVYDVRSLPRRNALRFAYFQYKKAVARGFMRVCERFTKAK